MPDKKNPSHIQIARGMAKEINIQTLTIFLVFV
jgi:argininosuccinate lyase